MNNNNSCPLDPPLIMNNNTNYNTEQELSPAEKKKAYQKAYYLANKEKLAAKHKAYRDANPERKKAADKAYRQANLERVKAKEKAYREAHREEQNESYRKWHHANKEKANAYSKAWYAANKEYALAKAAEWQKTNKDKLKAQRDNIQTKLRNAVTYAFTRIRKNKPTDTQTLLGCTWKEAKAHFESLFQEGMSWENHGEWHIDHVRPVASFNQDELYLMNHISNLQPLWAEDNLSKGDKF